MSPATPRPLDQRSLSYPFVDATRIGIADWHPPAGLRSFEKTVVLGVGDVCWAGACHDVLTWKVKTRSGFSSDTTSGASTRVGDRLWLVARVGPMRVREPIEVVSIVETDGRCGLAYGTLEGHPVSGEEAFVVSRDPTGVVSLTVRSLTEPGHGRWRAAWPAVRLAQGRYRNRYLRALSPPA